MAAATSVIHERGTKQFQGMFSEMWAVKATWDPASAAAGSAERMSDRSFRYEAGGTGRRGSR